MNINLVKKSGQIHTLAAKGEEILEVYQVGDHLQYFLFDPFRRSIKELYPQMNKEAFVRIVNCSGSDDKIFFCCAEKTEKETVINIYRGSITDDDDPILLCSFTEASDYSEKGIRLTAFILSENMVLIQKELPLDEDSGQFIGRIKFDLTLFDAETNEQFDVSEETYINNGISLIRRIADTKFIIKTGFNCLEDSRIPEASEEAALIEGVYFGDADQFCENLKANSTMHELNILVSTYNDKYIVSPGFSDNYLYFTVADADKVHSETFFHNISTEEKISFRNDRPLRDDLDVAYVVDGIPYIKINNENSVDFLNLRSADIDINFPDEEFVALLGKLFIMQKLKYNHNHLRFYHFPKLKMVLDEKAEYAGSCCIGDNYYIYI